MTFGNLYVSQSDHYHIMITRVHLILSLIILTIITVVAIKRFVEGVFIDLVTYLSIVR